MPRLKLGERQPRGELQSPLFVLSRQTSMIFMMPMPPTNSETAARAVNNAVTIEDTDSEVLEQLQLRLNLKRIARMAGVQESLDLL